MRSKGRTLGGDGPDTQLWLYHMKGAQVTHLVDYHLLTSLVNPFLFILKVLQAVLYFSAFRHKLAKSNLNWPHSHISKENTGWGRKWECWRTKRIPLSWSWRSWEIWGGKRICVEIINIMCFKYWIYDVWTNPLFNKNFTTLCGQD